LAPQIPTSSLSAGLYILFIYVDPVEERTEVLDYFANGGDGFSTKSKLKLELRTIG
jgi:hypothetical protein